MISKDYFDGEENATILEGFSKYNRDSGFDSSRHPVALAVYGEAGELIGALDGYTFLDWLTVSRLWVAEPHRSKGIGTQLMEAAENIAKQHDCVGLTLSTYEFQAKPFYEKLGYGVFGVLKDNPRGSKKYFMQKQL